MNQWVADLRFAIRCAPQPSPPDRARGGFLIGAPFMVLMVVFVRNLLTGFALPARHAARVPPSQALRV